jgi:hypothetical protein
MSPYWSKPPSSSFSSLAHCFSLVPIPPFCTKQKLCNFYHITILTSASFPWLHLTLKTKKKILVGLQSNALYTSSTSTAVNSPCAQLLCPYEHAMANTKPLVSHGLLVLLILQIPSPSALLGESSLTTFHPPAQNQFFFSFSFIELKYVSVSNYTFIQ